MRDLLLLGASGLAREAAAAAQAGHRVLGVLDDDPDKRGTRVADIFSASPLGILPRSRSCTVSVGSRVLSKAMMRAVIMSPIAKCLLMSSLAGEKSLPKTSCAGRCAEKTELMSTSHDSDEWSTIAVSERLPSGANSGA